MSEHRRLSLSEGGLRQRLPATIVQGRVIGHGQQLAARRLSEVFARPIPEGRVTRQQLRSECLWGWRVDRDDRRAA